MATHESAYAGVNEILLSRKLLPFRRAGVAPAANPVLTLSRDLRADLLDPGAWAPILETCGRTGKLAVALTDTDGHMLGSCHNPQPLWAHTQAASRRRLNGACPFCLLPLTACTAVADALRTREPVIVRDSLGLVHVAVPLYLDNQPVGAIVAGQVFDHSPIPILLQRLAEHYGLSLPHLRQLAAEQQVAHGDALQVFGDLLGMVGHAFLRQRFSAILEKTLAERNRQFRLLVEGVNEYALFTMDAAGRVTTWNAGAQRLLGYAESSIVGHKFSRLFTPEDIHLRLPEKQFHKASREGRTEDEGWRVREDGTRFWANVIITALVEEAGPLPSFAVIVQDVTERRRAAIELDQTRQDRMRLQEKFLSHVSHELRTPLTAIYFFTTNLLDGVVGEVNPEQRQHLVATLDNVKQLKNMVSDLLDVTRVDTMKLTLDRRRISLVALVAEVGNTCLANASAKNITLQAGGQPDGARELPLVWADPARVRQILTNLIDNAIKFTPAGGTVTFQAQILAADPAFLCVSVADTGCGISPENQLVVFDHLVQLEASSEASRKGLGLGLFIARELVQRQGGRIWLESEPGRGSTFYFTLPVFSLAKLCAPLLTPAGLSAGFVTLVMVGISPAQAEAFPAELSLEIRRILHAGTVRGQDLLLPDMHAAARPGTFFILTSGDPSTVEVMTARIRKSLGELNHIAKLDVAISLSALPVPADGSEPEKQREVTARMERSMEQHLAGKANPQ